HPQVRTVLPPPFAPGGAHSSVLLDVLEFLNSGDTPWIRPSNFARIPPVPAAARLVARAGGRDHRPSLDGRGGADLQGAATAPATAPAAGAAVQRVTRTDQTVGGLTTIECRATGSVKIS